MIDDDRTLPVAIDTGHGGSRPSTSSPRSPKKKSGCKSRRARGPAYRQDVQHFMRTLAITAPEELRQADHKAVIAWERYMRCCCAVRGSGRLAARMWGGPPRKMKGVSFLNPGPSPIVVAITINIAEDATWHGFDGGVGRRIGDAPRSLLGGEPGPAGWSRSKTGVSATRQRAGRRVGRGVRQEGLHVVAVVVDLDGVRQAVLRGNGAPIHTLDNAFYKAYSSASC